MSEKEMTQAQKYHFRRELEALETSKGMHTELVSLYVPPSRPITDAMGYMRSELSQASNIKSKQTKKNVTGAIESILSRLRQFKETPPNGLVFFVGEVLVGNNKTSMEAHVFEPPQPITTFLYRCDNRFYLDPLRDMLTEKEVYGMVVLDRREFTAGFLRGKTVQVVANRTSMVPGKHGRGGQSAQRFERLTEIAADEWLKECAEKMTEIYLDAPGLQGIIVGGPGPTKQYFVKEGFLHHELAKKVVEPLFDVGYTDESGLRELAETATQTLKQLSLGKEKRLMQRLLSEITKSEGGLAVYGEKHVRAALSMGAVETLIVSEDLRRWRLRFDCEKDGPAQRTVTVKDEELEKYEPPHCEKCGNALYVGEKKDLVEELSDLAAASSTEVELVSSKSEEGETLMRAFGGIAGILRYNINLEKVLESGSFD